MRAEPFKAEVRRLLAMMVQESTTSAATYDRIAACARIIQRIERDEREVTH